jgi:serine/threonine-protein kinase
VNTATLTGTVLNGTYRLDRRIGEGGMGVVFEATHQRLPRRLAVKVLSVAGAQQREAFERFRREAEIASSLGHDHIVQVFDFNYSEEGFPYLVMELLEGEDLTARIAREGRLSPAQTARILEEIVSALTAAHGRGIVHRDLKPPNIFLARKGAVDFVKILDFGVSKVLHAPKGTVVGTIFGTPNYMAPEQAEGRQPEIDQRTDIFALGAILYECLTGRRAFDAADPLGTLYQVCHTEPEPVRKYAPDTPEAIQAVITRALAKRREERYATAAELCEAFVVACRRTGTTNPNTLRAFETTIPASGPLPAVRARETEAGYGTDPDTAEDAIPGLAGAGRRRALAAGAVGVAIAMVVLIALMVGRGRSGGQEPSVEARAEAPAAAPAPPSVPAPSVPVPIVVSTPSSAGPVAGRVVASAPAPGLAPPTPRRIAPATLLLDTSRRARGSSWTVHRRPRIRSGSAIRIAPTGWWSARRGTRRWLASCGEAMAGRLS